MAKFQISVTTNDAQNMVERVYSVSVDTQKTESGEELEATVRNMVRIIDLQAHSAKDDDEGDDGEGWKAKESC